MKYRFLYLIFMLVSATISSAFATSSKKKTVPQAPEAGVMNWKPTILLDDKTPKHNHTSDHCRIHIGGNTTPPHKNAIGIKGGIQCLKMLGGHVGIYAGAEYMQQQFTVTTVNPPVEYAYKHLQAPVIFTYMPSPYIHVGVGAKYSYLLAASVAGKVVPLANNNDFNRHGVGLIADLSFGWSVKSPRLGIQYIYNTGAALVGQTYNTIDVSIRVPFGF